MVAAAREEEEEMADTYVRPDVVSLGPGAGGSPWDERLLAYARAVRVMEDRPPREPASWAGQAALYRGRPRGSWFFLPWLRMHLWYFERIVRGIVVEGGGPRDWALPFWGCSDGPPARATLPPAFAAPALPDGTPNPLHRPDGERAPFLNSGFPLPAAVTNATRALSAPTFSPGLGGLPGGPESGGDPAMPGLLEAQPHDSVLAALGRDAALDPVFPLHLAAVDRLWETWLAQDPAHQNPAQFDWTDQWFSFCDADGRARSMTCGQAGDLANLDYVYAGLRPRACAEHVLTGDADHALALCTGRAWRIATGATESVELGADARRVALRPADDARAAAGAGAGPVRGRVYLHLEDASAVSGAPGSVWEVRVEGHHVRPPGAAACVGTIALTGPDVAQRFVFDITDAVDDLASAWDERGLAVTFHPALPADRTARPPPAARVGRVFLTHT
jgi:tyrosinase